MTKEIFMKQEDNPGEWEYLFLNHLNDEPAMVWKNMAKPGNPYICFHDATDKDNIQEQWWTVLGIYEKHKIAIIRQGYWSVEKNEA